MTTRRARKRNRRSEGAPADSAGSGLPTPLDISPTKLLDLDEKCAYEHFFGKTLEEAREMFAERRGHVYLEDLGWMGARAFDYYVHAYMEFLDGCNPADVDIEDAMFVVKMRAGMGERSEGLKRLIAKIEELRHQAPPPWDIEGRHHKRECEARKYEQTVQKILGGSGLPTRLDISPSNLESAEEKSAYKHFFGKTLEEARAMFAETSGFGCHIYIIDLWWMGKRAFDYYVQAYIDWLESCSPADDVAADDVVRDILAGDIEEAMSVVRMRIGLRYKDTEQEGVERLIAAIEKLRPLASEVNDDYAREYEAAVWWLRGGEGEKC